MFISSDEKARMLEKIEAMEREIAGLKVWCVNRLPKVVDHERLRREKK